jgi:hypothetical protein
MGWTEAVVAAGVGAALTLAARNVVTVAAMLFLVPWLYCIVRYAIEVGNSAERYKAIATFGLAFAWLGLGGWWVWDATQRLMMSVARLETQNNLKSIAVAMAYYEERNKELPRVGGTGQDGKPVGLSWRVQLLPYLGEESLYQQFKLDAPWDAPANKRLLRQMPKVYAHPLGDREKKAEGYTYYRVFVGPDAGFRLGPSKTDWLPSRSNTIMVVEAAEPVPWTKPEELEFGPDRPLPPLGGLFPGYFLAVFFDGSVDNFDQTTDEATLRYYIAPRWDLPPPKERHGFFGRMP